MTRTYWRLSWVLRLSLSLWWAQACKSLPHEDSDILAAKMSVPWENLKVGQKFRMSPPNESSQCYLPGDSGLKKANCGDQTYWIVTKSHNPHIKQIKSLIDNKCLGFMGREFGMQDCTQDDSSPSLNGWGDKNLSPLQRQYFALLGDRLVPAFKQVCNITGSRGRTGGKCTVVMDSSKPLGATDPITFTVMGENPTPDSRLVYRSTVKKARDEEHNGSFASEIRWGHLPRITGIYVATNETSTAAINNTFITGIQLHFSDGSKQLIGSCRKDKRDLCKVNTTEHPGYPNPKFLAKDEYITDVGMKFGEGGHRDGTTKLIALMIKTNKYPQKAMLWKGHGDPATPWQWLSSEKDTVIAGFFGTIHRPENYSASFSPMIRSMGVIYAHVQAYRAHHPDAFQATKPKAKSIAALSAKDGRNIIGSTEGNATFNSRPFMVLAPRGGGQGDQTMGARQAYQQIFQDPSYQFSSTFYAGTMGNSARTSSIRMYFKESILTAIVVHPDGVGGLVQPEVYGEIPEGESPNLYIELGPKEHITSINWKSFHNQEGQPGYRRHAIKGPLIYGIQIITSKGRRAEYSAPEVGSNPWQYGMGKSGYAIVGFHGSTSQGEAAEKIRLHGIINLGAWVAKISELP